MCLNYRHLDWLRFYCLQNKLIDVFFTLAFRIGSLKIFFMSIPIVWFFIKIANDRYNMWRYFHWDLHFSKLCIFSVNFVRILNGSFRIYQLSYLKLQNFVLLHDKKRAIFNGFLLYYPLLLIHHKMHRRRAASKSNRFSFNKTLLLAYLRFTGFIVRWLSMWTIRCISIVPMVL